MLKDGVVVCIPCAMLILQCVLTMDTVFVWEMQPIILFVLIFKCWIQCCGGHNIKHLVT